MCRLQSTHRGPLHPQSAGSPLAQQVPEMQRLSGAAVGEVLQQGRQRLLQRGLLQVSSFQKYVKQSPFFGNIYAHFNGAYIMLLCIDGNRLISQKEIRDQMRRLSAGDPAHAGGEEGAGLRLPPALFRLHRVQKATGHRGRVLSDGGQQAGVQGRLRDRQAER